MKTFQLASWLLAGCLVSGAAAQPALAPAGQVTYTPEEAPRVFQLPPSAASVPSAPAQPTWTPPDPLWPRQGDLAAIGMPQVWPLLSASPAAPVTVAVLDTGYVETPELRGRNVRGPDFVSDPARAGDGDGRDPNGSGVGPLAWHAEVVAGLIAAAHDGKGMAGINPSARIVQVRVAGVDGLVAPNDLIDGLRWAAGLPVAGQPVNRTPARIINLSLYADFIPLTGCHARIRRAAEEVMAKGVLVVVGAGNDGKDTSGYSPAGCPGVLTVTSVDSAARRPSYANWGPAVSLAAPGGGDSVSSGVVASSVREPGGIKVTSGTSFAAPHVSGVASVLLSRFPGLSRADLQQALTRSATPFSGGKCDPDPRRSCGAGLLNAPGAWAWAARLENQPKAGTVRPMP
ncbi:S8 family serine peptidase [Deinococcus lacus]|uniref:S8 family serine peptidase n=1 Tax=Deinococcus lacus TaxID=392561 RepID=A0ABW1YAR3_9DEIO